MQSPWREPENRMDGLHHHHDRQFGHILERSTSAPPVSTEQPQQLRFMEQSEGRRDSFLFGNGTDGDDALFSASGRDSAPLTSEQLFMGREDDENDRNGRATAPGFSNSILSDTILMSNGFSEQPTMPVSRSASVGMMDSHLQRSLAADQTQPPTPPQQYARSQSAAPVNRPPPGLGYIHEDNARQFGQRRSASTGLLNEDHDPSNAVLASLGLDSTAGSGSSSSGGGRGAVRPAPKTLMDLIHEDTSPATESPVYANLGLNRSQTAAPYYDRNEESLAFERSRTASPLSGRYQQQQQQAESQQYDDRHSRQEFHRPQPSRYQQQPQQMQQQHPGMKGMTQQMDRLQVGQGGQQYGMPNQQQRMTPPDMQHQSNGQQYVTIPVNQVQRGQRGQHELQQHQEPARPQPRSVYAMPPPQQQQQHQQQPRQQYDASQPYYAPNPRGMDQGMPPNAGLTPAVLPNGQTVYINTNPQQYGGYAVQYAAQPPPQHSSHGVHHQQEYMMPMQGGGQAYWPDANGMSQGPVIMASQVQMQQGSMNLSPNRGRGREANNRSPTNSKNNNKGGGGGGGGRRNQAGRRDSNKGGSGSSAILDEFRASKNRDWTMLDIKGHVVEFCQDQNGSRFIQQRLEIGNASEQQVVMAEVLPAVRQLRNDVFGNYVVQKLLQFGTPQMKIELRDTLKGEMLPLSLQMYGCRVVQKALEALDEDDLPQLLTEFHHNVLSCIHDQNGNHVIQKCIEVMSIKAKDAYSSHDGERAKFFSEEIDFIINDVLENVTSLSCHPYGCRVLQRILEHCVEPKKLLALDAISKSHRVLLDDQYGNYVIQHVLQYGRHEDRDSILDIVVANGLLQLSKQKFASNVVEKLLKYGTPSQRNALVREMLKVVDDPNTGGSSVVLLMVRDAYANYVVQTTLDVVSEGEEKRLLLDELNRHSAQLRQYTFAKHIVTKLSS